VSNNDHLSKNIVAVLLSKKLACINAGPKRPLPYDVAKRNASTNVIMSRVPNKSSSL